MADGAKFKLYVEGEKEFKAAINDINSVLKVNRSELKLLADQYKVTENPMANLKEQQESLSGAMELQAEKSKQIAEQMEKAADTYGEQDARVKNLIIAYNDSESALAKLQGEYQAVTTTITDADKAMANLAAAQEEIDNTTKSNLVTAKKSIEQIEKIKKANEESTAGYLTNKKTIVELSKTYSELDKALKTQEKNVQSLKENLDKAEKSYGKNSTETKEYRKQLEEATEALENMNEAADDTEKQLDQMKNGGINDIFSTVSDIAGKIGLEIPDGITTMIGATSGGGFLGAAAAAGTIVTALTNVIDQVHTVSDELRETYEWADEVTKKAERLGVDTETYQALEYAAEAVGVGMDSIDDALNEIAIKTQEAINVVNDYYDESERLKQEAATKKQKLLDDYLANEPKHEPGKSLAELEEEIAEYEKKYAESLKEINEDYDKSLQELNEKVEESIGIFDSLGVELKDKNGDIKSSVDIFYDLSNALSKIEEPSERISKATEILGDNAKNLKPIFENGADALKNYMDEAKNAGIVIDESLVKSLDEAERKLAKYESALESADRKMTAVTGANSGLKRLIGELKMLFGGSDAELIRQTAYSSYKTKFDAKKMFGYASGTQFAPGGWSVVGEKGPEIVRLPRGSEVYPNGVTPRVDGGNEVNYYNIEINADNVREFNDIVRIAQSQRQSIRAGYVRG